MIVPAAVLPKPLRLLVKYSRCISFAEEENYPYNEQCIEDIHGPEYPRPTGSL